MNDKTVNDIKKLKNELIEVLTKLDAIAPIQFADVDCDNLVYNFHDVKYNENDDKVYIEMTMWTDSLPVHKHKPLLDGRGRKIPYLET